LGSAIPICASDTISAAREGDMRRGSWWAWVAFSALWVALVAWICSMRIDAELATTTVMPWEVVKQWLAWTFTLPAALLALGLLFGWVIRGFKWSDIRSLS